MNNAVKLLIVVAVIIGIFAVINQMPFRDTVGNNLDQAMDDTKDTANNVATSTKNMYNDAKSSTKNTLNNIENSVDNATN